MRRAIALAAVVLFCQAALATMRNKRLDICKQGHRGILFHIRDHSDLSKGCKVTAVLKKDCLKLLRCTSQFGVIRKTNYVVLYQR